MGRTLASYKKDEETCKTCIILCKLNLQVALFKTSNVTELASSSSISVTSQSKLELASESKEFEGNSVSKEKKNKVVDESVAKLYDEYDEELDNINGDDDVLLTGLRR